MVINNGIAEVLEYGDIVNGGLIFPDSVTAIDADIGQVEEMSRLFPNVAYFARYWRKKFGASGLFAPHTPSVGGYAESLSCL